MPLCHFKQTIMKLKAPTLAQFRNAKNLTIQEFCLEPLACAIAHSLTYKRICIGQIEFSMNLFKMQLNNIPALAYLNILPAEYRAAKIAERLRIVRKSITTYLYPRAAIQVGITKAKQSVDFQL